jgi:hypothetical protein
MEKFIGALILVLAVCIIFVSKIDYFYSKNLSIYISSLIASAFIIISAVMLFFNPKNGKYISGKAFSETDNNLKNVT